MANNNVVTMSGNGPTSYMGKGRAVIALTRVLSLAVPAGMVEVIWTPGDMMFQRSLRCLISMSAMISSSVGGRRSRMTA